LSDFFCGSFGDSKPNRRMIKRKTIGIVLMAYSITGKISHSGLIVVCRVFVVLIGYFSIRVLKGHISEIRVWGAATRWGKRKPLYAGTVLAIRTAF
jgi:hypothetical protein